jgi:hypothetical protein
MPCSILNTTINAGATMETNNFDGSVVDATYITESGSSFEHTAPWPHENSVSLRWGDDDETVIDFVYFGSYKNRLIYHAIRIEECYYHLC